MIYIDNTSTDPAYNLALEEYLVVNDTRDVFMLWQNAPAVIVGRNQHTENQVNREYAQKHGIAVVRRLSGGGAVYHDAGNLNFTIILRDAMRHRNDFTFFTNPILEVLQSYGVDARFSGRNDLTVEGKKFSGNAQYNYGSTVLHHGTILWDSDLSVLAKVLKPKERVVARGVDSHESRVTNLVPYVPDHITLDRFKEDLLECMLSQKAFVQGGELDGDSTLDFGKDSVIGDPIHPLREKYLSDTWNWGEGPAEDGEMPVISFPASC